MSFGFSFLNPIKDLERFQSPYLAAAIFCIVVLLSLFSFM
jgi:hypothetical protein